MSMRPSLQSCFMSSKVTISNNETIQFSSVIGLFIYRHKKSFPSVKSSMFQRESKG